LEEVLLALSPEFHRLRNPLLRRTVARLATLEQAAKLGNIPVRELVARLRQALGQASPESQPLPAGDAQSPPPPAWVVGATPAFTFSAEEILASGRTPVAVVSQRLGAASPGQVGLLVAPFHPAPLVDALAAKGYQVFARPASDRWEVWVRA
jgi:hypothetical protein